MTGRSVESSSPPTPDSRGSWLQRAQRRGQAADRRIRRIPAVKALQSILDTYAAAGGGITAGGLAYGALFAVIPGLLLVVSLIVVVIGDRATQAEVVDWIVVQVPPLAEFAQEIVAGLADSARVGTVFGLVGLVWGASGFYVALEGAMDRLFPGPRRREPILGRVRGMLAVVLVVGGTLVAFLANYAVTALWSVFRVDLGPVLPAIAPLVSVAAAAAICLVVYVIVPSDTPGWRSALPPAIGAGIGIGLLTSLFGLVSQFLVAGFTGLGVLASVFVALVWFNWVFQMLLYGGAWARLRRDRRQARGIVL